MGVRIIEGNNEGDSQGAVLYCSTSGWAFGPVFEDREEAELFIKWCPTDPRKMTTEQLERAVRVFRDEQETLASPEHQAWAEQPTEEKWRQMKAARAARNAWREEVRPVT